MEKKYLPLNFEKEIFDIWDKISIYKHINNSTKENYSIVLPPPNVTGKLHLGHAWDGTIQDFLIRFKKIDGYNTYWVAGKDHAGIATQTAFEKYLQSSNQKKEDFSRKEFIDLLIDWVKINDNSITKQWKRMGFLLDYTNQKFTLDDNVNDFVNSIFKSFYNEGLIYRRLALVNWDIKLKTAISDIEVIKKETNTKLYTLKYKIVDSDDFLLVATTRPETIFADIALVVNPNDERYQKYIGKFVINPLNKQKIEIIADNYVDQEYGTGVMKCTPAHDFNDYKIANKLFKSYESCINLDGTMNSLSGQYEGLDRLRCREILIRNLEDKNLLVSTQDHISFIGHSERTNEIIEPLLSKQWFISMKELANKVINDQMNNSGVKVFPENFNYEMIKWLENIQDWCISRQLWWGHQIPIWYHKKTGEISAERKTDDSWEQDSSVFDTWFSSSLWPIIVFNQSENCREYEQFFPSSVLVTAYDIIFFWVARMMMMSKKITLQIPFKDLFVHGLIRDKYGNKLSKSLGNFVDLFSLCDKYGVDALRLFLLSNSTIGQDLIYSEDKVSAAWNLLNKLWNIGYFINLNWSNKIELSISEIENSFDKWILFKLSKLSFDLKKYFDNYNFVVGIKKLVNFIKNDFSNIYIDLNNKRIKEDKIFIKICAKVLKNILVMLHPVCCFTTEKIYQEIFRYNDSILKEKWPESNFNKPEISVDHALEILENVRFFKWNHKMNRKSFLKINIYHETKMDYHLIQSILEIENTNIVFVNEKFDISKIAENKTFYSINNFIILYDEFNDKQEEINQKIITKLQFEIERSQKILSNENYLEKAPKILIDKENNKLEENKNRLEKLINKNN
ncbi:MAG: valine--tRNA ligase [Mycoplasmoidaceae bacterium]